jgi:hypothetical protein
MIGSVGYPVAKLLVAPPHHHPAALLCMWTCSCLQGLAGNLIAYDEGSQGSHWWPGMREEAPLA